MSIREEFEYEAGKALSLPVSIIEQARKGDRYDHDFDSMSLMQPLNGWWHWWQAGREGLESRLKSAESNDIDARCHVAELEAKCAALATENAALKATSDDRRMFIMNAVQLGYIKVPTVETDPALETIRVAVSPQEPTPATDAFLAEVRAISLEDFADVMAEIGNYDAANYATKHAHKIRQEAAQ
ncbi:hypothetical protein [Leclercia sp. 119287]|uniref:hypothetical protein n=1 Tax=Leclercia sp. 119287 TaxID=2681308 RepID=UPI001E41F1B6|nr:hypothetical protein [Leclercia sp. 119287]